jgi:thiol-disulfide isomerase/thioredoxin
MTNTKTRLLYIVAGLAFTALGVYAGIRLQQGEPDPAVAGGQSGDSRVTKPGAPAPSPVAALFAMSMNDPTGQPQALSQWKGKTLIVNFWAPWCAPCVEEMPELAALGLAQASNNVQVIGVGIDTPANIKQFSDKLKIAYPLYVSGIEGTELARQFGNAGGGLPYTVLVGADGEVKKTYLGRLKFEQLKADLASLGAQ